MNAKENIKIALRIAENINNGVISPKNLYDLQLHLSIALSKIDQFELNNLEKKKRLLVGFQGLLLKEDCLKIQNIKDGMVESFLLSKNLNQ